MILGRKQPIYILVDAPLSMNGEPINCFQTIINDFIKKYRMHPAAIENMYISILISNSKGVEVILPLTDLISIQDIPQIICKGKADIFKGIEFLISKINSDNKNNLIARIKQYKPILFLMVGTIPQINFPEFFLVSLNSELSGLGSFHCPSGFLRSSSLSINGLIIRENPSIIYYQNKYVGEYYKRYFDNILEVSELQRI